MQSYRDFFLGPMCLPNLASSTTCIIYNKVQHHIHSKFMDSILTLMKTICKNQSHGEIHGQQ